MNDQNKAELRRLAEAAPPGPWFGPEYAPGTSYVFDVDLGTLLHYESIDTEQDQCLRYVAAAHPAAVLSLLDENAKLRAEVEALRKDSDRLNWLDGQYQNVVEGSGSNAELVAHKWVVEWPASTVRDAIDAMAKEGSANG